MVMVNSIAAVASGKQGAFLSVRIMSLPLRKICQPAGAIPVYRFLSDHAKPEVGRLLELAVGASGPTTGASFSILKA
jgi:hypothetical protein